MPRFHYPYLPPKKRKNEIILIDGSSWELTLREAIFSVLIVGIMTVVGWFISGVIERNVHSSQLIYKQAAQIKNDKEQFAWAVETDVGHVFVEGDLETVDPVKHEKLDGEWMCIFASHQKYQMHTRVVTYTVSNGKGGTRTKTRTETYWSWDTVSREKLSAKKIKFSGVEFPLDSFSLGFRCYETTKVKTGLNKRIVFDSIPLKLHGSVFAELKDKTIANPPVEFMKDETLEDLYVLFTTSHATTIFWVIWILFTVGLVIAFFVIENDWLED